jgi:Zn-dependent protease
VTEEPWQPAPQPGPPAVPPHWEPIQAQEDFPYGLKARIKKALAPLIAVGAFLAKFGVVLLKLKSVVFLGSAAVSVVAYAQLWGWRFALGFVLLILVHELGHVIALRVRGIKASALVFLPLLGAFTAWQPQPRSEYEEAETALAGPVVGAIGALTLGYVAHRNGSLLLMSLAFTGLLINLFNLAPVRPLDGGRITTVLHPWIWIVAIVGLLGYELYRPGVLALVLLVLAGYQLYHQMRDPDGSFREAAASVTTKERTRISTTYLAVTAATLLGMHWTYVERHLS